MRFTNLQRARILYKTILKLHRGLPEELQLIGTSYVRDEFKRHKACSGKEADIFIAQWTIYAVQLAEQLGLRGPYTASKSLGSDLTESVLTQFRDEQIHQLYELMLASKAPKQVKEVGSSSVFNES